MIIHIEEIREGGLTVDRPIPQALLSEALGGERDTGFRAAGPSTLHATFQKLGKQVLLHGRFGAPVTCPCKRCLADVNLELDVDFHLDLVPHPGPAGEAAEGEDDQGGERAGTFELDDADREPFDGKTIDLDPILREQVLLALPMDAVCREDCRGLCGMCGQNLNEKQCGCESSRVDPRLAALKDIKL